MGNFGVFDECIIADELAFGCTGITTAIGGTSLGVSPWIGLYIFYKNCTTNESNAY